MAQIIKPKRSETAGAVPQASDLQVHEIAMNVADGKLYTKAANNSVVLVGSHSASIATEADILAFTIALG